MDKQIIAPQPSPLTKQRDLTLDVLKGLGIILMVMGHSGVSFVDFIYLFHMALFFMASGYTWKDDKVKDLSTLKKAVISRIKALWLPYTLANGIYTLMNNQFLDLGLYSTDHAAYRSPLQTAFYLLKNLLFTEDTRFGGASWFLRTLFIVSVAHLVIRYIACHWKYGKVFFCGVIGATLVGAEFVNLTRITIPLGIHTCFCAYTAFLLGMLINKLRLTQRLGKFLPLAALAAFGVLLILNPLDTIGLGVGNIGCLLFYVTVSLAGWLMIWGISALIKGFPAKIIAYCGKHSIWILLLHFLAFKPVTWIYLLITGADMAGLSSFPTYPVTYLWPLYTIVGVVLPLLFMMLVNWIKSKIKHQIIGAVR